MLKQQYIIRNQYTNQQHINQQHINQQYINQKYVTNQYTNTNLYPRVIMLDVPNLEINKNNKNYNINEIKKRINNTYYLKIMGLN